MTAVDGAIVVRAEDATAESLTFEGWVAYDGDDPESYPFITARAVGDQHRPMKPTVTGATTIVRRIRIVVPL